MGRITRKRSIVAAIAATAVTALGLPGAAGAATATYPAGGSGFTGRHAGLDRFGPELRAGAGNGHHLLDHGGALGDGGQPARIDQLTITTLVNAGGLLKGETTWTSPNFTLAAGSGTRSGAVALDRRLDGGVVALGPESTYEVSLIDRTAGNTATKVLSETIDDTDSAFAREAAPVPAGCAGAGPDVRAGHQDDHARPGRPGPACSAT